MNDDDCVLWLREVLGRFVLLCTFESPRRHLAFDDTSEVPQASFGIELFDDLHDHDAVMTCVVFRGKKTPAPRPGVERFAMR